MASPGDAGSEPGLRFAEVSRSELRERMFDLLGIEEPADAADDPRSPGC